MLNSSSFQAIAVIVKGYETWYNERRSGETAVSSAWPRATMGRKTAAFHKGLGSIRSMENVARTGMRGVKSDVERIG